MSTFLNPNAIVDGSITPEKMMEGEYLNITSGFSHELTGHIEATHEEFTFRPSAGDKSIRDDSATIKSIKGNSLVWNQLSKRPQSSFTITSNDTERFKYIETGTTFPVGTKCFVIANYEASENTVCSQIGIGLSYFSSFYGDTKWIYFSEQKGVLSGIVESKDSTNTTIILRTYNLTNGSITFSNVRCVNLTKMFGAGNEPTTIEEFYARIPEGVDMNAYNEGRLISMNTNAIKTIGFNQWDEQWEVGRLDITTGLPQDDYTVSIRSKNYIRILPNKEYYLRGINDNSNIILFYDVEYNYISYLPTSSTINKTFTTPVNANYMKYYVGNPDTPVTHYNNDICINLSHSGVRNGEYEPYKKSIKDLSVIQKYFPNGMRSAGSAYDEIKYDEAKQKWVAIQRISEVDLGSLTAWENHSTGVEGTYNFVSYIPDAVLVEASKIANIVCSNLHVASGDNVYLRKYTNAIALTGGSNKTPYIAISHPTYTTSAQKSEFMTSIQGIILYYELAEPIVTEIDDIVNFSYEVGDFGTEEIISNDPTTPFKGDIVYQFNAVDRIRDNSRNIEKLNEEISHKVSAIRVNSTTFTRKDNTGLLDIGDVSNLYVTDFTIEDIIAQAQEATPQLTISRAFLDAAYKGVPIMVKVAPNNAAIPIIVDRINNPNDNATIRFIIQKANFVYAIACLSNEVIIGSMPMRVSIESYHLADWNENIELNPGYIANRTHHLGSRESVKIGHRFNLANTKGTHYIDNYKLLYDGKFYDLPTVPSSTVDIANYFRVMFNGYSESGNISTYTLTTTSLSESLPSLTFEICGGYEDSGHKTLDEFYLPDGAKPWKYIDATAHVETGYYVFSGISNADIANGANVIRNKSIYKVPNGALIRIDSTTLSGIFEFKIVAGPLNDIYFAATALWENGVKPDTSKAEEVIYSFLILYGNVYGSAKVYKTVK